MSTTLARAAPRTSTWLFDPLTDGLVCCGGLLWFFVLLQSMSQVSHWGRLNEYLLLASVVGMIVLTAPHFAFSFIRRPVKANEFKLYSALLVAAFIFATSPYLPSWLCKCYVIAVIPHYTHQIVSMARLYISRATYVPLALERVSLAFTIHTAGAFYIAKELAFPRSNDVLVGVALPLWSPLPVWIFWASVVTLILAAASFLLAVFTRAVRDGQMFPCPVFMLLLSTLALFVCAGIFNNTAWLYAAPFLHASQSVFTTLAERRKASEDIFTCIENDWKFVLKLVVVGALLVFALPAVLHFMGSPVMPAAACVLVVASFYHFWDDCVLWRERTG